MRKTHLTAAILAASLLASAFAGCSGPSPEPSGAVSSSGAPVAASSSAPSAAAPSSGDPVPLTILSPEDGRVVKEDNPVWLELEKRTNTDLTLMLLPGADIPGKLNTMAASDTLPDIVKYKDFFPYAQQGLLLKLDELVDQYAPNMKAHIPENVWEYTRFKGDLVALPYYNDAGKWVMAVRQDWLDKLGLGVPTTLDELYDMAVKFANEDPDGNGERDSYAFSGWTDFMPIYTGYGILYDRHYFIQDNKAYTTNTCPEYKEVLTYINRLWNDKAIDPDFIIMQSDQRRQKLAQGKNGMLCDWWSLVPEILVGQLGFEELNPDGEWTIISPTPKGPGGPYGDNGTMSQGDFQQATWLSANTKNPVAAIQFLDYLVGDEGFELIGYGIKGVHYNTMEEGRTAEGTAAFEEKWLDSFNQLVGRRTDIVNRVRLSSKDPKDIFKNEYIDAGYQYNLYISAFFGLPATEADMTYGADLANFENESRIAFITGERSLDEYDAYVQEWLAMGGGEILQQQIDQYNELRGEHVENGLA